MPLVNGMMRDMAPSPQARHRTMGPGFGPGSRRELMQEDTFTGRPTVRGRRYMISSVHYLATMGGLRLLQRGGNAVDAGVAAGLCITDPCKSL